MKIYHHNLLIISLILIFSNITFSSEFNSEIKGKVSYTDNDKSIPVIGARVSVKGTNYGAITDKNGNFNIKFKKKFNEKELDIIVIATGFESKIVKWNIGFLIVELEEKVFQSENIVVTANKKVEAIQDVPISISNISERDLQIRQMNSLDVAIQYVPGVQVNRDNVSIRGSSGFSYGVGSRVSMLIDGFPILSADNGDIKYDALPIFNTKNIEVVKGAGSALYGTSAIGGVINLITTDDYESNILNYRVYSGIYTKPKYESWIYQDELSFDSGFDFTFTKKIGDLGVLANLSMIDRNSWREYDEKRIYNSLVKLDYKINDYQKIKFISNISLSKGDDWAFWNSLDSATIPPDNTNQDIFIQSDKYAFMLGYENILSSKTILNVKSGTYFTKYFNNYEKSNVEYRQSDAISYNNEIQFNTIFNLSNNLTYGLNILSNNVSSVVYSNRTQNIYSAYSQYERKSNFSLFGNGIEWILTIGVRLDYERSENLQEELQFSPKLGNNFKLNENNTIKLSGGKGFRAPQIAERFAQIRYQGFIIEENFELTPEISWSGEFSYIHENEIKNIPVYFELALFQNNMENLIEPSFKEGSSASIQFKNLSEARIRGIESTLKTLIKFIGIDLSFTYLDPVDLSGENFGEVLKYRSKFISQNKIYLILKDFQIEMDYRHYSRIENIDDLLALQIRDANVRNHSNIVDVRVNYNTKNLLGDNYNYDITLNCFNIFDYYYTQMVGNLGRTRQISLQIKGSI